MTKPEQNLTRRGLIAGIGAVSLSHLVVPRLLAQEMSLSPEKNEDFLLLKALRDIADEALSRLYLGLATGSEGEVYNKSFNYGEGYHKFEKKYGVGEDFFDGKGRDLKNDFHNWYIQNEQTSFDKKLEMLHRLISDFKKEVYKSIQNEKEDLAITTFLKGFFCGYYEKLCPPIS
jgi:hypothetical protein